MRKSRLSKAIVSVDQKRENKIWWENYKKREQEEKKEDEPRKSHYSSDDGSLSALCTSITLM